MEGRGRPRRLAPDHRLGLHHLRDLWTGQRRGATPQLHRQAGLSHPLLAIAAGTGEVLLPRLREGRANTARGAGHFLRETVGRVRYGGARGQLTVRADSGFYTHAIVAVCPEADVRFSITVRQHKSLRNLIEAIPETDWCPFLTGWTPPPMWPRPPTELVSEVFSRTNVVIKTAYNYGRLLVGNTILSSLASIIRMSLWSWTSETSSTPPSRVRRTPRRCGSSGPAGEATPGSHLALFATYSYHAFITDRNGETLELEADHRRRDRERHPRPQVRRRAHAVGALRRQRRLAGGTGDGP